MRRHPSFRHRTVAGGLLLAFAAPLYGVTLQLSPCTDQALAPTGARCGTYEVFEDRAAGTGRRLPLHVVVLPAAGEPRQPDPLVFFAGGPGESATAGAPWAAHGFAAIRAHRDLVFIDLRGTGRSAPLSCPELAERPQGFLDAFLPVEGVRACRRRLAAQADPALYTTAAAVDDVAEVLTALGYARVNLHGASYGTRSALEMMRRHPQRVRTATLFGVVPPDARAPLTFARDAQDALDATLAECAAEPSCAAAFPRLREELAALLERAEREPLAVRATLRGATEPTTLRLDRHGVAQTLRYMLYVPAATAELPLVIHAAASGDFQPLGDMAALFAGLVSDLADGYFLSIECAEDVAFIRPDEVAAAVAGTFLGDFRIRAQREACAAWDVPPVPASALSPVRSTAPVLLLSGERDPVTPARWGDEVARHLPNGRHLVVADAGHGMEGMKGVECLDRLVAEVIARGDVRDLDTGCLRGIARAPFTTERSPATVTLSAEQLAPLAGRYGNREGLEVAVRLTAGKLDVEVPGQPPISLTPIGPRRFRLDGLPASYQIEFVGEGAVTTLLFYEGAATPMQLERRP
jgi:pimeloyl-ACP methyl ester carboxylesterase